MLPRMQKERLTISVDRAVADRVRRCGAQRVNGGASGYLERLVRQDEVREATEALVRWYARHTGLADADDAERVAVADELGEPA